MYYIKLRITSAELFLVQRVGERSALTSQSNTSIMNTIIANSSYYSSRHKTDIKAKNEKQSEKQVEKEKEKDESQHGNEIDADISKPVLDMQIDDEKEKSVQELDENLDKVMKTDYWAASLASLTFSFYDEEEGQDSTNRWH